MNLLTIDETAELLRVHPVTIRRMVRRGDIPALKIGKVYRIDATDLKPRLAPKPQRAPRKVDETKLMRYARLEWRSRH